MHTTVRKTPVLDTGYMINQQSGETTSHELLPESLPLHYTDGREDGTKSAQLPVVLAIRMHTPRNFGRQSK